MTVAELESRAERLLSETRSLQVPVPIEAVARRLKLTIKAAALGLEMSGVLVVEDGRGVIGYNVSHATARQRFTIAHEVAHFVLHAQSNGDKSQVFVDRYVAYRRDERTSSGNDKQEVEANRFGAALLMPRSLVHEEITQRSLDLDDEDAVVYLARRFHVSMAAMSNRLSNLRLLR